MLYAEVALGVLAGPFDYALPDSLAKKAVLGARVWVDFRNKKTLGYVVKLKLKSPIENLKNIIALIDEKAIIDDSLLRLAKEVSEYYCSSWGQAIESMIPSELRKGRAVSFTESSQSGGVEGPDEKKPAIMLAPVLDRQARWRLYLEHIRDALDKGRAVIFLLPDIKLALLAQAYFKENLGFSPELVNRNQPDELLVWVRVRQGQARFVLGVRSGIFAPVSGLGLIIIDEEQNSAYKQEQSPHYNAREVAIMRAGISNARLILGSHFLSLESYYLGKKGKAKYLVPIELDSGAADIKVIDMKNLPLVSRKRNLILSQYLHDSILSVNNKKGRVLLFLNRKGFATFAHCNSCGMVLRCQRCSANLVYHFQEDALVCHYCNFKMQSPDICPGCNSSYIKYSGAGTEKVESELARIFPQSVIKRLDNESDVNINESGIFVATEFIVNSGGKFDLIGVLSVDNYLNRVDFRSSEKALSLIVGFLVLAKEKLIIQTSLPGHHCFKALVGKDLFGFYNLELSQRKQLKFAPYQHMALLKLRGRNEDKVKAAAGNLFNKLKEVNLDKQMNIVSANPGYPLKLRGNFHWQILLMSTFVSKLSNFINKQLSSVRYSGIVITVDIDPT